MSWKLRQKQAGQTLITSNPGPRRRKQRDSSPGRTYRPRELREARVSPSKALGQHFLTDYTYVNRIASALDLTPESVVVEIGPGLGVLTERLAAAAGRVICVELDSELASRLREKMPAPVTVVEGDALLADPAQLLEDAGLPPSTPYVLAGNLPYNVGTAIVRRFLEAEHQPERLVVMLQKEVADGMAASEGELGLLGVSVQVYARAKKLFNVPPRAFYPPPRVTSAVVRLDTHPAPMITPDERDAFFRVVRAGFSAPRKQVRNTLAHGLGLPPTEVAAVLEAEGLQPGLRPQDLSVDDWLRLTRRFGAAS